jgi:hypothetical protein
MMNLKQFVSDKKKKMNPDNKGFSDKVKSNLTVAGIGAGMGLVIASSRNKNLVLFGSIGAIIGVTLMNLVKPKTN